MKNNETNEEIKILYKEIDIALSPNFNLSNKNGYYNKIQNKTKKFFIILSYSSILIFYYFILSYSLTNKISNKLTIDDNSLFNKESLDDYTIIPNNTHIKEVNILNIALSKETIKKVIKRRLSFYLTQEMVDKYNNYIKVCYNDTLIDNKKYPLLKNPKISVTIPIYNGGKYLYYSLRSIQNQKMKEIEIILIDDCSTDDTLSIIESYMKEDERIRLIKNIKNRKILYSKSMAALNANGKYIIQLDQDDLFIRDDVFDILYSEAEKNDLDLVQIRDIVKNNFYFNNLTRVNRFNSHIINPKETHFKSQPKLKDTMFIEGNNYLLWGLLIKADIYKKAIYKLWPIIINYKITFQEDYMITFMIIILAQKYKYLNNFALIHLNHNDATSKKFMFNPKFYINILFVANNIYEYYIKNNPEDIKILFHYIKNFYCWLLAIRNYFNDLKKYIFKKICDNEYLSDDNKRFIEDKFHINNKEQFKIWDNFHYINDTNEYKNIYNYQTLNINQKIKKLDSQPIISIIIVCSEYKYLDKTVGSIQNQNFTNFEIILIYDNKEKKDLNLIKQYIKGYSNINFINNKCIKGFLYSYSTGVLHSKGKYILLLEPSNTLAKENVLNQLYNEVKYDDISILEFDLLVNNRENITNNSLSLYKCKHIKSGIHLSKIKYNKNILGLDQKKELIINKLIKSDLFKLIINEYQFNIIKRKIFNYYDNIFLFALERKNITFKRINIYGVIQNIKNSCSLNISYIINDKNQEIKDSIFYINFLYEASDNTFSAKEKVLNEYYNILNIIYNKFNKVTKESYTLYKKFINSKYISQINKEILQFYCKSLIN